MNKIRTYSRSLGYWPYYDQHNLHKAPQTDSLKINFESIPAKRSSVILIQIIQIDNFVCHYVSCRFQQGSTWQTGFAHLLSICFLEDRRMYPAETFDKVMKSRRNNNVYWTGYSTYLNVSQKCLEEIMAWIGQNGKLYKLCYQTHPCRSAECSSNEKRQREDNTPYAYWIRRW